MKYLLGILIILVSVFYPLNSLFGQDSFVFTKKFNKKLKRHNIEFFYPVERWLKTSSLERDQFMKYDLVLDSPPDIQVRIDIDRDKRTLFPNVMIQTTLSNISTNDENAFIEITQYPNRYALETYGADLALYADFTPKSGFTSFRNGRMLCLYKEGNALIKFIILYDDKLDPYFKLPLRFKSEELDG